jgi:hypothetical protein
MSYDGFGHNCSLKVAVAAVVAQALLLASTYSDAAAAAAEAFLDYPADGSLQA